MDIKMTAAERKTALDNLRTNIDIVIRQTLNRIYPEITPAEFSEHFEIAVKQYQMTMLLVAQSLMSQQGIKSKDIPFEIEMAATLDVYNDIIGNGGLIFYRTGQVNVGLITAVTTRGMKLIEAGFNVIAVFNQMYIPELMWRSSIASLPVEGLKNVMHALLIIKDGHLAGIVKYVIKEDETGKSIVPEVTVFKDTETDADAKAIATIMRS